MNELWKIMFTTRFITIGYFKETPKAYVFKIKNRNAFFDHLKQIEGQDIQSEKWLSHLRNVNYYCDEENIQLLDDELAGLKQSYNQRTSTTVHRVVYAEKAIFEKNAANFPIDTLNYDLRKYRPNPCFLPDGKIRFKDKSLN